MMESRVEQLEFMKLEALTNKNRTYMIEIEVRYCGNNIVECHSKLQKAASNVYVALNEYGV